MLAVAPVKRIVPRPRGIICLAALSQSFAALYKTNNFDDALYTVGASLAASVTAPTQLKEEVLDTYKTLVTAGIEKNDVALIFGMVFKR